MSHRLFKGIPALVVSVVLLLITSSIVCAAIIGPPPPSEASIEINAPDRNQVVFGQTVSVTLTFAGDLSLSTFRAILDGNDVTSRFTLNPSGATAELTKADGLRITTKDLNQPLKPNNLKVSVNTNFDTQPRKDGHVFYVIGCPEQNTAHRACAMIPPSGGQVTLEGQGTVTFPAGSFTTVQRVILEMSTDPDTNALFNESMALYDTGAHTHHQLHIETGGTQPLQNVSVRLNVPLLLLNKMSQEFLPAAFALLQDGDSTQGESYRTFDRTPATYDNAAQALNLTLAPWWFSNGLTVNGNFEAITMIALNRTTPTGGTNPPPPTLANLSCKSRPDVHWVLFPPLDGKLKINSDQNYRVLGGVQKFHSGVDYATHDAQGNPTVGQPVRSMDDGTVLPYKNHKPVTGDPAKDTGFGTYVVVKHNDGSRVLYAHLSAIAVPENAKVVRGQIIALSGDTGLPKGVPGVGPHLHVTFVPTPTVDIELQKVSEPSRVSVVPCVHHDLYVPIRNILGDGHIFRFDLTSANDSDFTWESMLAVNPQFVKPYAWLSPSWAVGFNQHVYAGGGGSQTGFVSEDGNVIIEENYGLGIHQFNLIAPGLFGAVTVDRPNNGGPGGIARIVVADGGSKVTAGPFQNNYIVFRFFSVDGTTEVRDRLDTGLFFSGNMDASDELLCVTGSTSIIDPTKERKIKLFDHGGSPLATLSSTNLKCGVTNDRLYTYAGINLYHVDIFDRTGALKNSFDLPPNCMLATVSEKNVFATCNSNTVSGLTTMQVFKRTVVRDRNAIITTDTYDTRAPIAVIAPPLQNPSFFNGFEEIMHLE